MPSSGQGTVPTSCRNGAIGDLRPALRLGVGPPTRLRATVRRRRPAPADHPGPGGPRRPRPWADPPCLRVAPGSASPSHARPSVRRPGARSSAPLRAGPGLVPPAVARGRSAATARRRVLELPPRGPLCGPGGSAAPIGAAEPAGSIPRKPHGWRAESDAQVHEGIPDATARPAERRGASRSRDSADDPSWPRPPAAPRRTLAGLDGAATACRQPSGATPSADPTRARQRSAGRSIPGR
jgi:hypothetical protein